MDYYKILSEETMFWTRIGMNKEPVEYDDNGEIAFYSPHWEDYIKEHKNFYENGVKVYTTILHNGWVGVDKYDYGAVDKTLEAIFSVGEDVLYMPRIKLNAPLEWCKNNPKEVFLNEGAPRDINGIKALMDNLTDYYDTGGMRWDAPKDGGLAGLQSICSDKWIEDASIALKRLIEYLENSKYSKKIIGYHIGFGMCAENAWWHGWFEKGMWGDCGIAAAEKFKGFCIKKYGNEDKVKQKFTVSDMEMLVPHPDRRSHAPADLADFFMKNDEQTVSYNEFLSEYTAAAICKFAHTVKLCSNKPVGAFYGYVYVSGASQIGHLAIQSLIDCKDIDFLASPKGYYKVFPGGSGGTQAAPMSVSRKKIWLDELDFCTHIGKTFHNKDNVPKDMFGTRTIIWREVCKNLSWNNQNFWFMDLFGGWYLDDEIMQEIKNVVGFIGKMRKKPRKSIAQILFVNDEKSLTHQLVDNAFGGGHFKGIMNELSSELLMCGAPVDEYRLSDLADLDLSNYKMIVFANSFVVNSDIRRIIKGISNDTVLIFNYAAGIINDKYDIDNVRDLTGMGIHEFGPNYVENGMFYDSGASLPAICINDEPDITAIERYENGKIKTAVKGNVIFSAAYTINAKMFHDIAEKAGCKIYAPAHCTVYADNRFIGIFPSGSEINMNFDSARTEYISGAVSDNITVSPCGAAVFENKDL